MPARARVFRDIAAREARRASAKARREIAEQIAEGARAAALVHAGDDRDGIAVEVDHDRVFVVDGDPDAMVNEFGTSETSAHAALTDAARQYGRYDGRRSKGRR
ncbi:HK97 gp10 family phage protein [Rhodococcus xishaensis]|uniref:HK97 gp10 family phage protein n=1 Tax=Rhodococcus xishaensis TaxID=2487364 RepID=A0A3S3AEV7_9NOCA|nr:HK97 gp10 family phage protein [Rhodococcus xishaensis]RVW03011.1 HK97 gp10 family phage protein [Rhodococcus xishaensis]